MTRISGLYAVTPDLQDTALLIGKTRAILAAGARLVQYRNKVADDDLRREQASALCRLCRQHGAALIINDHVEIALAVDADGVHIGMDDTSLPAARARLGHAKIIGVSCYDDLQRARIATSQGADYVACGSFFASTVKPGAVRAPLALLREARQQTGLPVVAIGGITVANSRQLLDAGADALAVISSLYGATDVGHATREFCRLFEAKTV